MRLNKTYSYQTLRLLAHNQERRDRISKFRKAGIVGENHYQEVLDRLEWDDNFIKNANIS